MQPKARENGVAPLPKAPSLLASLTAGALRGYQILLSPLIGPACRFTPSCSEYARQAVLRHGATRGLGRGARRLLRCHPFHAGGWDPVD